jgi:hypothetical protein
MPIGGSQALTVHKLPGGARMIDVMGQDDDVISWSGMLYGEEASSTARTLDKLRRSGTVVTLAWDVFSYQVLVSQFSSETRTPPMRYKIGCTILQDNTQVSGVSPVTMALQVTQDIASGQPVAALGAVSQGLVTGPLASAATAIGLPNATIVGSADYNAAVGAVNSAATAIQTATTDANAALAPLGVSLQSLSAAAPAALNLVGMSGQIASAASSVGDLAQLAASSGFVNRAAQNLKNASA